MGKIKVNVITLGCAKNQIDSERIKAFLSHSGFDLVDDEDTSDIFILNTCGFIEEAKRESLDEIWRLIELKDKKKLIVCGCLAQRYSKLLWEKIPEIDALLGISDIPKIGFACKKVLKNKRIRFINQPDVEKHLRVEKRILKSPFFAYLRIADGCENFCTYCSIPQIRGKYRSKPTEEVLKEAKYLADQGIKEINLVAQDTTLYGEDIYKKKKLQKLLSLLSEKTDVEWIRLLYTHPAHYSFELIQTISKNPKVCKYLDLPLQHISDKILSKMGRKITKQKAIELIEKLREEIPDLSLRTTFLVGFPGEREKDFEELLDFVEKTKFDWVGAFVYSKEENTKAYDFKGQIPAKVKHDRFDRLLLLQQNISFEKNKKRVGKKFEVLIEGKSKEKKGYYVGRTQYQAPEVDGVVFVKENNLKIGDFVQVKITEALDYDLVGKVVK